MGHIVFTRELTTPLASSKSSPKQSCATNGSRQPQPDSPILVQKTPHLVSVRRQIRRHKLSEHVPSLSLVVCLMSYACGANCGVENTNVPKPRTQKVPKQAAKAIILVRERTVEVSQVSLTGRSST